MSGWFKFQWGPIIGALIGAGLMAALAFGQETIPAGASTRIVPARDGVVDAAWGAIGRLVNESAHKLTFKLLGRP